MKIIVKLLVIGCSVLQFQGLVNVFAEEAVDADYKIVELDGFSADDYHTDHNILANFIPNRILNPDDSLYSMPDTVEDYFGIYKATADIEELNLQIEVLLNIEEDGLFNLAYYFIQPEEQTGSRFYIDKHDNLQKVKSIYQDLTMLTGAFIEADGGLMSGLIRKTISPVLLLDGEGHPSELYPYNEMAYELRESYQDARVYQNVGLYINKKGLILDVNHLIGLDSDSERIIALEKTSEADIETLLVENHTFEILQNGFDEYLINHNDFKFEFETYNDFVQTIQAMHLKSNASFPTDTTFELINPTDINMDEVDEDSYALIINHEIIYVYNGENLYFADEISQNQGLYHANTWYTN